MFYNKVYVTKNNVECAKVILFVSDNNLALILKGLQFIKLGDNFEEFYEEITNLVLIEYLEQLHNDFIESIFNDKSICKSLKEKNFKMGDYIVSQKESYRDVTINF